LFRVSATTTPIGWPANRIGRPAEASALRPAPEGNRPIDGSRGVLVREHREYARHPQGAGRIDACDPSGGPVLLTRTAWTTPSGECSHHSGRR
jgi:hypothetical protein